MKISETWICACFAKKFCAHENYQPYGIFQCSQSGFYVYLYPHALTMDHCACAMAAEATLVVADLLEEEVMFCRA